MGQLIGAFADLDAEAVGGSGEHLIVSIVGPAEPDPIAGRPGASVEVEAVDPALHGKGERQHGHGGAQEHERPCREVEQAPLLPRRCEPRRGGFH